MGSVNIMAVSPDGVRTNGQGPQGVTWYMYAFCNSVALSPDNVLYTGSEDGTACVTHKRAGVRVGGTHVLSSRNVRPSVTSRQTRRLMTDEQVVKTMGRQREYRVSDFPTDVGRFQDSRSENSRGRKSFDDLKIAVTGREVKPGSCN